MNWESEQGTLCRCIRCKRCWGLVFLSVALLLTPVLKPGVQRCWTLYHIAALDGTIDYIEPDFSLAVLPSDWEDSIRNSRDNNEIKSFDEVKSISLTITQNSDLSWLDAFPNLEHLSL
ncbi:hypothetical protein Enr17x_38910 [Gimesia fumaroli]|uniref:Uncharacterized protein n=2 Tax=Gimesia fumaroli TaxID=2527976 RepID=A0A518IFG6_9PLAN|nr:hypothetical protein Enr17x_38910 [Gimesia fumaroli]